MRFKHERDDAGAVHRRAKRQRRCPTRVAARGSASQAQVFHLPVPHRPERAGKKDPPGRRRRRKRRPDGPVARAPRPVFGAPAPPPGRQNRRQIALGAIQSRVRPLAAAFGWRRTTKSSQHRGFDSALANPAFGGATAPEKARRKTTYQREGGRRGTHHGRGASREDENMCEEGSCALNRIELSALLSPSLVFDNLSCCGAMLQLRRFDIRSSTSMNCFAKSPSPPPGGGSSVATWAPEFRALVAGDASMAGFLNAWRRRPRQAPHNGRRPRQRLRPHWPGPGGRLPADRAPRRPRLVTGRPVYAALWQGQVPAGMVAEPAPQAAENNHPRSAHEGNGRCSGVCASASGSPGAPSAARRSPPASAWRRARIERGAAHGLRDVGRARSRREGTSAFLSRAAAALACDLGKVRANADTTGRLENNSLARARSLCAPVRGEAMAPLVATMRARSTHRPAPTRLRRRWGRCAKARSART